MVPSRLAPLPGDQVAATVAAAVAAAVALILLAPPVARADSLTHRDRVGDVSATRLRTAHGGLDITRYDDDFAYGRLRLSTAVVSTADTRPLVVWEVRGGGSSYTGHVALRDGEVLARFGRSDGASCDSAVGSVRGDTVTLVVPVACLPGATSVRVANYTIAHRRGHHYLVDDANQGRLRGRSWPVLARPLAYSP